MEHKICSDPQIGRILWLSDGKTQIGAALDTGIRIVHLSCCGMENLFYRQPADLSDGVFTQEGWKLLGGHRFWTAPESAQSYWPEREPVEYALDENSVTLTQQIDPWTGLEKTMRLEFCPDGSILAMQSARNMTNEPITCALWGVNTLAGGSGTIGFANHGGNEYNPSRTVSLWGETSLDDPRLKFTKNLVSIQHAPRTEYFKIGVYSSDGRIVHENFGQQLEICIPVEPRARCADGGCNVEVFLHKCFMELETLGPIVMIAPGKTSSVSETWRVKAI